MSEGEKLSQICIDYTTLVSSSQNSDTQLFEHYNLQVICIVDNVIPSLDNDLLCSYLIKIKFPKSQALSFMLIINIQLKILIKNDNKEFKKS
ncbi:hypothetical protein [Wolbachia endosymbiont of Drosophila mauritiana]|uniref:hypothetical protein n=1 Tax=Wolbachia endosymbiont of Drosophila mauritiana TaxID=109663 RepID=UPI001CDC33DA|nr:hypothetical protein [Wolbachia endosymbiont of Drosophila mauritiana]